MNERKKELLNQVVEQMPDLPEGLQHEIQLSEAMESTDLQVLFNWCIQRVMAQSRLSGDGLDTWKDGQQIIDIYCDPEIPNSFRMNSDPELVDQLRKLLDTWLIGQMVDYGLSTAELIDSIDESLRLAKASISQAESHLKELEKRIEGKPGKPEILMPDRYRFDPSTGTLYEYSEDQHAYLFAAKANGRSRSETIRDYEDNLLMED